tara:strand:+ start:759 stop:1298 length:540 start_codon:yes stop_codon:yes gene_type:complete
MSDNIENIIEYEYNNDKLDEYNQNIFKVIKLIYKCIPLSIKNKILFKNKPTLTTINYSSIKQQSIKNYNGITFKLFGFNFVTDLGEGLCGWPTFDYTYTQANQFNTNLLQSKFAIRKEKQKLNKSNNTYYTDYCWQVTEEFIKPIKGYYNETQIIDSWNKICLIHNIIDGHTFRNYLDN